MDMRDKFFSIFLKEAAESLAQLQQFLRGGGAPGEPGRLEAACRAAQTLKGAAQRVEVGPVHQISQRFEVLLERHYAAKTCPTAVEYEAMELAIGWLRQLLNDLQAGRSWSAILVADALTALELAVRYPGDTPLVELLASAAQQRVPQLTDPFAADPQLALEDDAEILRLNKDPFADDPAFGSSQLFSSKPTLLAKKFKPQATVAPSPPVAKTSAAVEKPDSSSPLDTFCGTSAEIPFDPFADDLSFIEEFASTSLPTDDFAPLVSSDEFPPQQGQPESDEPVANFASSPVAEPLDDPFADDFGFDLGLLEPPSAEKVSTDSECEEVDD